MSFQPVHKVLNILESQYTSRERKQFQSVVRCWAEVVGAVVAAQTMPLSIQRGVLRVATASSAWAQNLVFERQRILEKLNARLPMQLVDIRFSTVQWKATNVPAPTEAEVQTLWQQHPSRVSGKEGSSLQVEDCMDANQAFEHWATRMRSQMQHLPLCPQCRCPTPPGELERWQVCSLCAAKQW